MLTALILGLHFLASLILLVFTLTVAWERRRSAMDSLRSFLVMIGCYAFWTGMSAVNKLVALTFGPMEWSISITGMLGAMTGWSVINFSFGYPENSPGGRKGFLIRSTFLLTLAVTALAWLPGFYDHPRVVGGVLIGDRGWPFFLLGAWSFLLIFTGYISLLLSYLKEKRQPQRIHLFYLLCGLTPGIIFAFLFSFALPSLSQDFQRYTWVGPGAAVIVTAVIFIGISQNTIYDIQTTLHKSVFLSFVASMGVGLIYIPVGVYLSRSPGLAPGPALALFIVLLLSHIFLAWFFPDISAFMTGKRANPENLVRQVLALAADVDRDVNEICRDVAILLKLSLNSGKIVAAIPLGDKYRIMPTDAGELSTKEHIALLQMLNANVRVTRAFSRFINDAAPNFSLKSLQPEVHGERRRRRVLVFASGIRDELIGMGFEVLMPVLSGGRPLAIFLLGAKTDSTPYFQSEHMTLRTISSALSIALKNADEYGRIARVNSALLKETGSALDGEPIQRVVSVTGDRQIVYRGRKMEETLREIDRAAEHDESVIVLGETGSGKDLAVHLIHARSSRRDHPLIAINCAALADSLLENELFGHEKGAYTGADRAFPGLFEQAEGGVLFLDEIGEISETLQLKLLRVIEDRKVRRLGGKTIRVNIRIIAATNKDLKERVDKGLFRADLYYRLNVISIRLPPLRERREDVPALVEHFIHRYAERFSRSRLRVSSEALRLLQQHDWPGNVRELENTVLRAFVNAQGDTLTARDFPEIGGRSHLPSLTGNSGSRRRETESLDDFLRRMEGLLIQDALIRSGGNKARAAKDLGLSRTTFYHKLASLQKSG